MVSLEPLATLLTWQFAPSFLANRALDLIYKLRPSARPRIQEQAIFHARITHITLLAVYFIFSVVSSYRKLWAAPNYYQLLGFRSADSVHPSAEAWESALKSSWRKLTLRFHPDKLGDSATPELEAYFVAVRAGYEALSDPIRKVAYERFGPATLQSCQAGLQKYVTLRDYSVRGLQSSCGFYAFSLCTLLVLFMLQRITFGQYWRVVSLAVAAAIEFTLLTTPSAKLTRLSGLLPFEQILLAHHLFFTFNCALSQVGPVLFPAQQGPSRTPQEELTLLVPLVSRLRQAAIQLNKEVEQVGRSELVPFMRAAASTGKGAAPGKVLEDALVDALCDNRIKHMHQAEWVRAVKGPDGHAHCGGDQKAGLKAEPGGDLKHEADQGGSLDAAQLEASSEPVKFETHS